MRYAIPFDVIYGNNLVAVHIVKVIAQRCLERIDKWAVWQVSHILFIC